MSDEKLDQRFEEYMDYVGKKTTTVMGAIALEDLRLVAQGPFGHGYRRGFADGAASVGKRETSEQA